MSTIQLVVVSSLVGTVLFCAGVFLGYKLGDDNGFLRGYFLRDECEAKRRDKAGRFRHVET